MNLYNDIEIGGFLELELSTGEPFHPNAVALNNGRNSLEYILRLHRPHRVYLPKYTCEAVIVPLKKLGISFTFYTITDQLEIQNLPNVQDNELLLYVNYFGIKNNYTRKLATKYQSRLIVDGTHAFFFTDYGNAHAIYSPRKFFGVADGGYAVTNGKLKQDFPISTSYQRMHHLLKRIDLGPEASFFDFMTNKGDVTSEPIMYMSNITKRLLANIDYATAHNKRNANFRLLHQALGVKNQLDIDVSDIGGPYMYPLLTQDSSRLKQLCREGGIFVDSFWSSVYKYCQPNEVEYQLAEQIICLPVDQRYSLSDMQRLLQALSQKKPE